MLFAGISLKTQELYALVFATRYLDIFTHYVSFYNTVMKLIFLGSSFSIVWYIRRHKLVRRSYDKDHDTFRHLFLVLPCLILALLIHEKFTFREVTMSFHLIIWNASVHVLFVQDVNSNVMQAHIQTYMPTYICVHAYAFKSDWAYALLIGRIVTLMYLEIWFSR